MDFLRSIQHAVGWHGFEHYIQKFPGLGAVFAALITGLILFLIAWRYTRRLKMIDATLEFSKRFQDLLQQQHELNKDYGKSHEYQVSAKPNPVEKMEAEAWWWRFFDLLLYEFDFRRHGLLDRDRFREWMTWRWYDFHGWNGELWRTCGVTYEEGWKYWSRHPAVQKNPLLNFLNDVHRAKNADCAERVVRLYSTAWGRRRVSLRKWLARGIAQTRSRQLLSWPVGGTRDGKVDRLSRKIYATVTATLFLMMGIVHLLRIIFRWQAEIGGLSIPFWASWLALPVAGALAYVGFTQKR